jgi:[ribosomal protein S5]-alanine N-acetyltransferase
MISTPPFLTGHTIELHVPLDSDIMEDNWPIWYNDMNVTRHNSHGVFPLGRAEELRIVHEIMARSDTILLAIVEKETDRLIGNAALQNIDLLNRHCNIAITIGEKASISAGVEVFGLLAQHAFMRLNLHRIEDATHEKLRVFMQMIGVLGFKVDGIGKDYFFKEGVWSDKIYFSLLEEDFKELLSMRGGNIIFDTHDELLIAIKKSVVTELTTG